jgi:hypothetical protein
MLGPGALVSGFADVPVAFMALASYYLILIADRSESATTAFKYLLLGSLCCAGCALTKQAGLYVAASYPLLCYLITVRHRADYPSKPRLLLASCAVIVGGIAPWYLYKQISIMHGLDDSEIAHVTSGIHQGAALPDRISSAFHLLGASFEPAARLTSKSSFNILSREASILAIGTIVLVCLFFCLRDKNWRYLLALVAVPYYLIWAFFFSYDLRNVALAIPLFGIAMGLGMQNIFAGLTLLSQRLFDLPARKAAPVSSARLSAPPVSGESRTTDNRAGVRAIPTSCTLMLLASLPGLLGLIYLVRNYDDDFLVQRQLRLQRMLCGATVNRMFYDSGFLNTKGGILTDLMLCNHLPGFENRCTTVDFTNYDSYASAIKGGDFRYIYLPSDDCSQKVRNAINGALASGKYRTLQDDGNRLLIDTAAGP